MRVLLLNANYVPIAVLGEHQAIRLIVAGKAEAIVAREDAAFRSQHVAIPMPNVIRLRYFVRVPFRTQIRLNKHALLRRDRYTCAYCSKRATTMDHIRPRSKGGKHSWSNVVAACRTCNGIKGDKQLSELGWTLRIKPYAPEGIRVITGLVEPDPAWLPYIESIEKALAG